MNNRILKKSLFALILVTIVMAVSCRDNNNLTTILSVTDIHFSPFHDSSTVKQLIQTSYTQWDTVFSQIEDKKIAVYNEETTPELFELLLKSMGKQKERISAVVFTGDILAHNFNELFYEYSGNTQEKAKNDFIYKTMGYVSFKLRQTFPDAPIYFSLGNNDSYEGDYKVVDDGIFLQNTTNLFYKNFIDPDADTINEKEREGGFYTTYSAHGYYNQKFPLINNGRIIGLNTIFFSVKYSDTSPGQEELDWLEEQLLASEKAGEKVWLLLHIPPGINVYSSQEKSTQQTIRGLLFWRQPYNERYLELVQRYHEIIVTSFAGHTHMDDFRLIYNQDTINQVPLGFIHISPSVSPVFGNNPSFQIIEVNKNTGTITETTTYYADINEEQPDFRKEYEYTSTYHVTPGLNGLDSLYQMFPNNQEMLDNYIGFYPVSSTEAAITSSWQWYWCGIGNLTSDHFIKAYARLEN
jgi:sphingomyelin phosphodiesterase acid-like 3